MDPFDSTDIFGINEAEASAWRVRLAEVEPAFAALEEAKLQALARDPKWQVRRAIAERLDHLPDDLFLTLSARLLNDENVDVRRSAQRARRRLRQGKLASTAIEQDPEAHFRRLEKKLGATGIHLMPHIRELCNRQIELIVAPVVHDARNLVDLVTGQLDQLEKAGNANQRRAAIDGLREAHERTLCMLEELLRFSKSLDLHLARHSLAKLVNTALDQFRGVHPTIQLEVSLPPTIMVEVDGDALHRVFTNILRNAADALKDVRSPCIWVSAQDEDGIVTLQFRDNGPGIPREFLVRLRHFLPRTRSSNPESNGLGLPNSNRVVLAHAGSLTLDSTEGEGTSVTIRLPASR